ncbi:MAG: sugar nucleotide-binding protein, partial [Bacteroidales bacterium]|nr:sugar nucleotide-binding protein [Bacteroidales bacterium]
MKILVTGANGQLGLSLRKVASPDNVWIFTDIVPGDDTVSLDITDPEAVREMVAKEGIEAIVNCAAYTNVDAAEDNEALAELLNATAVGYLAAAMKEAGGLLVHISTDYVFGAEPYNTPCREEQKGTPTGVYGLTKLHGEQAILRSGVRHLILRTAWLYSEYGKNFVKTMLSLTATKPSIKVVFD